MRNKSNLEQPLYAEITTPPQSVCIILTENHHKFNIKSKHATQGCGLAGGVFTDVGGWHVKMWLDRQMLFRLRARGAES